MKNTKLASESDLSAEIGYLSEGNSIYICSTYSHIIVTLMYILLDGLKDVDVILYDDLPNCHELKYRLQRSNLFNNIIIFNKDGLPARFHNDETDEKKLKQFHYDHLLSIEKRMCVDLSKYEDVYTFYDGHHIGLYLQEKHIKYHLIEDGMNHFQHIYATPSVQEIPEINEYTLRGYSEGWFYLCCGQNPDCLSIEVNENKYLAIKHACIIERSRRDMISSLSSEQKKIIFNVFVDDFEFVKKIKNKKAIVFTSVLANDGWVDTELSQIKIYKDIIYGLKNEGYYVVIKPHPRDKVIYNKVFNDCYVMDRNFPSELLDFDPDIYFDKGVVIASSAMELIDCINDKVKLGFSFFKNYERYVSSWIKEGLNHPERYNW